MEWDDPNDRPAGAGRFDDEPELVGRHGLAGEDEGVGDRHDDGPPVGLWIAFAILFLIGIVGGWMLFRDPEPPNLAETRPAAEPEAPPQRSAEPEATLAPLPETAEPTPERPELPRLGDSDPLVRQLASGLSSHPRLVRLLASDDLVRRFVASVESVARGQSPRSFAPSLAPDEPFEVKWLDNARGEPETLVVDDGSYDRYDSALDLFTSLDTATAARLYNDLEPLFDDAYDEIGRPGTSFRDTVSQAIDRVLAVELPAGGPHEVKPRKGNFVYVDPEIELRPEVDKHLLRLGPERAARLQEKLRFLQAALDL